ncbi:multidrug effflux MFS transporter [Hydrogenovibrio halophilus]|uniref:multidrug effflux MFS transporter n=1 Tax=Hydrogenovibrio halophilus TaxID=373391 RepID=UPI0003A54A01|nr:multidrug effflux MFS transporter [Hydrogenovibrio halophilus]
MTENKTLSSRQLALWLGVLIALTPFAVDTYLPSVPAIAEALSASVNEVSLTVPLFLLGFGLGQLIGGPLSDQFGRKPVAFLGLGTFVLASLMLSQTESLEVFYLWRVVQALGGGFATVVSAAMVRDLFSGQESARVFSMIALVMLVAPLIAPGIGALWLMVGQWPLIFGFLAAYAGFLVWVLWQKLPETRPAWRRRQQRYQQAGSGSVFAQALASYGRILRHRRALGFLVAQGFASGALFVYITQSPFMLMQVFGLSSERFPLYFGLVVLGVMVFNRANLFLLRFLQPRQILVRVLAWQAVLAGLLWAYGVLFTPNLLIVLGFLFFVIGLLGAVTPNMQASFMSFFPNVSGSASALMGTTMFAFGGGLGMLMGQMHDGQLSTTFLGLWWMVLLSGGMFVFWAKGHLPIHHSNDEPL